ncbi:hypothetical protein LCGC14_3040960 [marine sediment metagenome]|uniref:Uncharacterized protein n=1 Tax=marine sediment metagenome TaxID=412755 RepID=A0A0F8WPF2_9ZZZZ
MSPRAAGGFYQGPRLPIEVEAPGKELGLDPLHDPRAIPPDHDCAGGREPAASFVETLARVDPDMGVFWNRYIDRWVIWRKPPYQEAMLVMVVQNPNSGEFWPLDNRVLAFLYDSDPETYGGLKAMWNFVAKRMDLAEERRKKRWRDRCTEAMTMARMHTQIRVGYGRSRGDKSVMHSQGGDNTPVPLLD